MLACAATVCSSFFAGCEWCSSRPPALEKTCGFMTAIFFFLKIMVCSQKHCEAWASHREARAHHSPQNASLTFSYSPRFDADLHFTLLKLGHCLLGYSEFVQTSKPRQHHRSHFFGVAAGRLHVFRFFPHVSVYHVLGFLRHICSFFSHVGDPLLCLCAPPRGSEGCGVCSLCTDRRLCGR